MNEMLHSLKRPDRIRELGVMALNGMFDEMDAPGVLRQAVTDVLAGDVAIVSSFGADSVVLLHMVSEIDRGLPIYFLETGKHFPETLTYVETLRQRLGLTNVIALRPDPADLAQFDPAGRLWETDPDSCCHIRKTEPLEPVLEKFGGWVTGRKRYQTRARGVLPHFELTSDDRIKVNPLAYWADADVIAYRRAHDLPEHPLYARGFRSIGCAPCTSAVAAGEDARAGRWRGLDKTECGIHFDFNGAIASPAARGEHHLWRNGAFVADPFTPWSEACTAATARYTHMPVPVFLAHRDEVLESPHPLGLLLAPRDHIEALAGNFGRFASIALDVGAFPAGQAEAAVRLLVGQLGYAGEIRAVGELRPEQIASLRASGATAFVVTDGATRRLLHEQRLPDAAGETRPVAGQSTEDETAVA
jgi:phosphoadenosine phosphosulfate reductase